MFQIENALVSLDVIEEHFICDLSKCKGFCCVDGDSGAPLKKEELPELERALPHVWNDLSPEAQAEIGRAHV